jgi:hypothetical protein
VFRCRALISCCHSSCRLLISSHTTSGSRLSSCETVYLA